MGPLNIPPTGGNLVQQMSITPPLQCWTLQYGYMSFETHIPSNLFQSTLSIPQNF